MMKNVIYMMLLAAIMALASCSQDDEMTVPGDNGMQTLTLKIGLDNSGTRAWYYEDDNGYDLKWNTDENSYFKEDLCLYFYRNDGTYIDNTICSQLNRVTVDDNGNLSEPLLLQFTIPAGSVKFKLFTYNYSSCDAGKCEVALSTKDFFTIDDVKNGKTLLMSVHSSIIKIDGTADYTQIRIDICDKYGNSMYLYTTNCNPGSYQRLITVNPDNDIEPGGRLEVTATTADGVSTTYGGVFTEGFDFERGGRYTLNLEKLSQLPQVYPGTEDNSNTGTQNGGALTSPAPFK